MLSVRIGQYLAGRPERDVAEPRCALMVHGLACVLAKIIVTYD
jgi:hypothetical protein